MRASTLADVFGHPVTAGDARRWALMVLSIADREDDDRVQTKRQVGATVAAVMAGKGVVVEDVAALVGMPAGGFWRRLSGAASFTADDLVRLGRALDVDAGVFLA